MTFRQLATSNIKGNWHRYSAYFLSSVFAVMIFFMYAAFIYHPDVVNGQVPGGHRVREVMMMCEYLIIIFSFFFTLYSSSAFLKSRQQEFGLLTLFGMTKLQLRRLVFYENMIISILAIAVGMGIGAFMTKLFLMALSHILAVDTPITFYIVPKAILLTSAGYLILFTCITVYSLRKVGRSQIVELIRAHKEPKSPPKFSWVLVILSVFSLALGYSLAYVTTIQLFGLTALPILGFTVLGTYFFYTQFSVAIIRILQRNKRVYYRRTNLLNISQAAFKLKDNARVLFNVSILCAVVLTATASFYAFDQTMKRQQLNDMPQSYVITWTKDRQQPIKPDMIKAWGDSTKNEIEQDAAFRYVEVYYMQAELSENYGAMVSVSDYNRIIAMEGGQPLSLMNDEMVLVLREPLNVDGPSDSKLYLGYPGPVTIMIRDTSTKVSGHIRDTSAKVSGHIREKTTRNVINSGIGVYNVLVVSDDFFAPFFDKAPADRARYGHAFNWSDWEYSLALDKKIREHVSFNEEEDDSIRISSRVYDWSSTNQVSSLGMFIGLFISLLFFIASGSVIYFKLFTELQDDQAYFKGLTRIGLSIAEIRRVVTFQVGLIFFAPCMVGSVHTLFALKTLSNLVNSNMMGYALTVVSMFVVMQALFFFAARKTYMRKILEEVVV
ncbi:ABC transporter permease [Paenibacillus alvei]|uniref:ABC transporter permease n=1 Tax=Paenibacillus alvei TaxID=44250 RepID=UPI00227E2B22|nr:ABC transporter permease [Paenibacillus alvei]